LALIAGLSAVVASRPLSAQRDSVVAVGADSISIRLIDVDLRAAVHALSRYLDKPIMITGSPAMSRITLQTPKPVATGDILRLLRGLVESQNLELVSDTAAGMYRVRAREAPRAAMPEMGALTRPSGGAMELFVIHLRHATAADVAATVNALYGRGGALGEPGSRVPNLSDDLRRNQIPMQQMPLAVEGQSAARPASLTGETTIVSDPGTNSLLIRSNRTDFGLIEAAVKELDVRPLQVLIEVLIAEVRRDRGFSFGVDLQAKNVNLPGTRAKGEITQTGLGVGDFALRLLGVPGIDVNATLRAAAARGDATIMSRPVVIAANNKEAEILVGSQRPFIQVSRSLPTDAPSRDQVVQYKEVGTRLVVRPTISADGYVMLEVMQEVNAATSETQFDAPVISTRTLQTRVLVKDGQTAVLGGLSDNQRDRNQGGVPILSSIPLLGGLFGRSSNRASNTELFLFLTPTVLYTDGDIRELNSDFQKRAKVVKP